MRRNASITKSVCYAINSMLKIYGMSTKVYIPLEDNSIYSGSDDGSLVYPEIPTYIVKSVIPDLFGDSARSFDMINTLFEDNNMVYFGCKAPIIPVNTLLIIKNPETLLDSAYKISALKEYRYKSMVVMNTYEIMPYNIKLGSQMADSIAAGNRNLTDLEDIGFPDNNNMDNTTDSITDNIDTVKVDDALDIKDANTPLRKRSVNTFMLD